MTIQTHALAAKALALRPSSLQSPSMFIPGPNAKQPSQVLIAGSSIMLKRDNRWLSVTLVLLAAFSPTSSHAATSFSGSVKGGLTSISGGTVKFYGAGNSGYGSSPALLSQTTSGTSGAFTISGFTCPAENPQTYVTATGGNSDGGSNSAIGLMALTGKCQSLGSSSFVMVNELTTAAAQWALAQFIDVNGMSIGTSSGNSTGLNNAVAGAVADLVISVGTDAGNSGIPASFLPPGSLCSTNPPPSNCDGLERLNSLANILSA